MSKELRMLFSNRALCTFDCMIGKPRYCNGVVEVRSKISVIWLRVNVLSQTISTGLPLRERTWVLLRFSLALEAAPYVSI